MKYRCKHCKSTKLKGDKGNTWCLDCGNDVIHGIGIEKEEIN